MSEAMEHRNADELHAVVFHEIRSPITVVRGYVDLLSRPLSENERLAAVRAARVALDRLDALLDDFMTGFGRDGSLLGGPLEPVDLALIARDVVDEHAPLFRGSLEFTHEPDAECVVLGVPLRLRQLLDNLITNSMKYGGESGTVSVLLESAGAEVALTVTDNGPGVPESECERIFEPFVRLERDRASHKGHGIGLWIARNIAAQCGGTLDVCTPPSGGAAFVVRLPRAANTERDPAAPGDASA